MYVIEREINGIIDIYNYITNHDLKTTFPNLDIAIRIFLTLPVTNCSAERGFSTLTSVKSMKRSTLSDNKLNSFMLSCSEKDIILTTDFSDIVSEFAKLKARKKSFV